MARCPGQDTQFWRHDAIKETPCPHCGADLEFYRDEVTQTCRKCGNRVVNENIDLACLKWCPHAEQCVGPERFAEAKQGWMLEDQRKAAFDKLMAVIPEDDTAARKVFQKLYITSGGGSELFNTKDLFYLREEDEALFERCVGYYRAYQQAP